MRVHVRAEHIRHGLRDNACDCPVALALLEAFEERPGRIEVTRMWFLLGRMIDGDQRKISLPDVVSTWIRRFDSGRHVEPFEFDIELVRP